MNHSNITTAVLLLLSATTAQARDTNNEGFIDSLMAEMSIEEKTGQLNLPVGGDVMSGTAQAAMLDLSYKEKLEAFSMSKELMRLPAFKG